MFIAVPGPIYYKGFPFNILQIYKAPVAAVQAFIAVIAHHKNRIFGDGDRPEIVAGFYRIAVKRYYL